MPEGLPKYTDVKKLENDYEALAREAASIVLCNYASLNMAI